jgi:hypothetical protein
MADRRFNQTIYTESMAKLLEHMNRVEAIQRRFECDQGDQEALTCKFVKTVTGDDKPWFSGFSFTKKNPQSEQTIGNNNSTSSSMLILDGSSIEDLLCSFLNENEDVVDQQQCQPPMIRDTPLTSIVEAPNSKLETKPSKRTRRESASDFEDIFDVKRVRLDQQFQQVMQQKTADQTMFASEPSWDCAGPIVDDFFFNTLAQTTFEVNETQAPYAGYSAQMTSIDFSAESLLSLNEQKETSPVGESSTYRYLVRNSRARRKNNPPLPQDAFQMSFKFRA